MASRSHRFQALSSFIEFISDINAYVYDIISFPVMWIKPQTIFADWFWIRLIIGVFWGIVFCLLGVVLRSFLNFVALQLYKSRVKRIYRAQKKDGPAYKS